MFTEEPDVVYVSQGNLPAPLVEGKKCDFQCIVANVAPARYLSVSWHKRSGVFHNEKFDDAGVYPLNLSSVVSLTGHRDDDGALIWCEAKLNFEPTGPSVPSVKSPYVKIAVLCKFSVPF